jgi:hypothetical protein
LILGANHTGYGVADFDFRMWPILLQNDFEHPGVKDRFKIALQTAT